jgi:hypothetical protein
LIELFGVARIGKARRGRDERRAGRAADGMLRQQAVVRA